MLAEGYRADVVQTGLLQPEMAGGAAVRHLLLGNPNLLDAALEVALQGHSVGASADRDADIGSDNAATG